MKPVRFAIIGCGAVASNGYLPAFKRILEGRLDWVIDADTDHAHKMAEKFQVPHYGTDFHEVLGRVDAVVIATPPALHLEIAQFFLENHVHVLCEKPLTRTAEEAQSLIGLAHQHHQHFAVSTNRRYSPVAQLLKSICDTKMLGDLTGFEIEEGHEFRWPMRSGYRFIKQLTGGGVLAEFGPHLFDSVQWWLDRKIRILEYEDDNRGGVESNAHIKCTLDDNSPSVFGSIVISNTRNLKNQLRVRGQRGELVAPLFGDDPVVFRSNADRWADMQISPCHVPGSEANWSSQIHDQLRRFAQSIQDGCIRYTPAREAVGVIQCINDCYRIRQSSLEVWERTCFEVSESEPQSCEHVVLES